MGLALLVFSEPIEPLGPVHRLLWLIESDHRVLRQYRATFDLVPGSGQPQATIETFLDASEQLMALRKQLRDLSWQYNRYTLQKPHKKILQHEEIDQPWNDLRQAISALAVKLDRTNQTNYARHEIWDRLDIIVICYEEFEHVLKPIAETEKKLQGP